MAFEGYYVDKDVSFLGEAAYVAYCDFQNWKSVHGEELPLWEDVTGELKKAWVEAGKAASRAWIKKHQI